MEMKRTGPNPPGKAYSPIVWISNMNPSTYFLFHVDFNPRTKVTRTLNNELACEKCMNLSFCHIFPAPILFENYYERPSSTSDNDTAGFVGVMKR